MKTASYPVVIKETYLDTFGHMNNATYLRLFEDARWEFLHEGGFGLREIQAAGFGPVILEINIRFIKELRLRDAVVIESVSAPYEGKVGVLTQTMLRGGEACCVATLKVGLFDLKERRLVLPTPRWLQAVGL